MLPVLYIVSPCYNEQEVLPISAPALLEKLNSFISAGRVSRNSRILFVNDGSKDGTRNIIKNLHLSDPRFEGISLAHNSGEQNAYLAGLFYAKDHADVIITTDCDLQDDINAMDEMLSEFEKGNEIVYGVRKKREDETALHRGNAGFFYKLMKLCGSELPEEHSQYRLMSKRAVEMLSEYKEVNMFLPALVPEIGLKHSVVYHTRAHRAAGKTNYPFRKLVRLAIEAVTSFSSAPLIFITLFALICATAAVAGVIAIIVKAAGGAEFSAVLALFVWISFISAGIFAGMRILGEYICKNYTETKHRPRYQVEEYFTD